MTSSQLDDLRTLDAFVEPAFMCWPEHVKTFGDDVCDFAEAVGRPMDPEQRLALRIMYSVNELGYPVALEYALIAARQNLKTATLEVAALYDLFVTRTPLGIWTAHKYDTTKESFIALKTMIDSHDFLSRRVKKIIEAIGDQHFELIDGERLRFRARSLTGARGLSTRGRLFLDEAFALQDTHLGSVIPTLSTFRGAQIVYGSSAGHADSKVLRGIRDRGRAGRIPYLEFCAPPGGCAKHDCRHEVGTEGCALDDMANVRAANPSLEWEGRRVWRISQDYIRGERGSLPVMEFARERLGWWDEPGLMTMFAGWSGLADSSSSIATRLAFSVVVSPDRSRSVIAAAGLRAAESDFIGPVCEKCEHESCHGHMHLEPLEVRNGTGWVATRVSELLSKHGKRPVVVASNSPAGALIDELKRQHVDVTEIDAGQVMDADAQLFDDIQQGTVRHMNYPELDAAIERATKRTIGKRWAFDAREPEEEVAVLQAVSQAAWASRNVRPRELKPLFAF